MFKVSIEEGSPRNVFFRAYGHFRALELKTFEMLSNLGVAPKLFAKDEQNSKWRIEEWVDGETVKVFVFDCVKYMWPPLATNTAVKLAELHKLSSQPTFPKQDFDKAPFVLTELEQKVKRVMEKEFDAAQAALLQAQKMKSEVEWLTSLILTKAKEAIDQEATGYDVVFSHNDCHALNIVMHEEARWNDQSGGCLLYTSPSPRD